MNAVIIWTDRKTGKQMAAPTTVSWCYPPAKPGDCYEVGVSAGVDDVYQVSTEDAMTLAQEPGTTLCKTAGDDAGLLLARINRIQQDILGLADVAQGTPHEMGLRIAAFGAADALRGTDVDLDTDTQDEKGDS